MISQIDISGIHYEVSEELKKYITKKFSKLDRFIPRHARKSVKVEVKLTERHTKSDRNQCEIIVHLPDQKLTARESTINMFAAIDIVEAKIKSQLTKYKDLHGGDKKDHHSILRRFRRARGRIAPEVSEAPELEP